MLDFQISEKCYGCGACAYVCPKNAIGMVSDEDGFLVPKIDYERCVKCGLCDKTCIVLNPPKIQALCPIEKSECKMAYIKDEDILKSASGGVFYGIAKYAIEQGYHVCGAIWNEKFEVIHTITTEMSIVKKMRGSKYVQSNVTAIYAEVEKLLNAGKKVLFSGTPCQIAALHKIVGQHERLLTIALICEGVPSPKVLTYWVKELEKKANSTIVSVEMRKKGRYGWKSPSTCYKFENGRCFEQLAFHMDTYMYNFLQGVFMRESCSNCAYKGNRITADIVIGDCWSASLEAISSNKNKGMSALIIRTTEGKRLFENIKNSFFSEDVSVEEVVLKNHPLMEPNPKSPKRDRFFEHFRQHSLMESLKKYGYYKTNKLRVFSLLYHLRLFGIVKKLFKGNS